jgi:hypothetical protein
MSEGQTGYVPQPCWSAKPSLVRARLPESSLHPPLAAGRHLTPAPLTDRGTQRKGDLRTDQHQRETMGLPNRREP